MPHSLRCKIKHLCHNGTITESERDRILKALEREPKILEILDFAIDASSGDTNYFVGFRNGLRYAKTLVDGEEEPQYESCTEKEPNTGHWIEIVVNRQHKIKCDKCDYIEPLYITHIRNYCPNCGAKMESEEIHCDCTDEEIAKSFIEDVEAVKDLLS